MKIGLNGATTMKANLLTDIDITSKVKYDFLEIWAAKLKEYLKKAEITSLKDYFIKRQVIPYSINSIERINFRDHAGKEEVESECYYLCEIASKIKCENIVVVPGKRPSGASEKDARDESVESLRRLSKIAEKFGVRLAFEFLGFSWCSINRLEKCLEVIEIVGKKSIGFVFDTFHFYAGESSVESIKKIDPKKLAIFHINDCEDKPREELLDSHRLLPGEGVIPLKDILNGLKKIGYSHSASIEIFRPEYWEMDPYELAEEAKNKTRQVLDKYCI